MISLIIPAYNEEAVIAKSVDKAYSFMKKRYKDFEIILGDDGSTDRTLDIIKKKAKQYKRVSYVTISKMIGKGYILTKSFKKAKGEIELFIDSDLSIDINLIPKIIKLLKDADIVIASKHVKGADVNLPLSRRFLGKGFDLLTRLLFKSRVKDHLCGLKAFRKKAIKSILPEIKTEGFLWDAEVLIRAERKGYKILEIPAIVRSAQHTTVNPIKEVFCIGGALLKLKRTI